MRLGTNHSLRRKSATMSATRVGAREEASSEIGPESPSSQTPVQEPGTDCGHVRTTGLHLRRRSRTTTATAQGASETMLAIAM